MEKINIIKILILIYKSQNKNKVLLIISAQKMQKIPIKEHHRKVNEASQN